MQRHFNDIHPHFKLQGFHYSLHELNDVAYSLIKEGDREERLIGDFLMDWISPREEIVVKTSGSTGRPKSISLKKQAMVNSALATGSYFGIRERSTALLCLSADHIAAKMMLVRAMVLGLSLDTVTPSSAPLAGISKQYDLCSMVPLQLEKSIRHLSKIGTILVGGAPIPGKLRDRLKGLETRIYETYGMTETCSHIAVRFVDGEKPQAQQGMSEHFHTLPGITVSSDDRGCLQIHAPELGLDNLKTNDLVSLVSETEFDWLGRWDNMINSGGVKLIPEQIEEKLRTVISGRFIISSKPDDTLGEKLILVLEGEGRTSDLLDKISGMRKLEKYEKPKEVYYLNHFPQSKSGKVKRDAIRKEILQ
ncbi:O-succinylbenzoic acid--CoA ligase [Muriicola jejuensis]|uniref:AMP-binding protein n=1 Tax=Muriicola jejuensis TaxID=504488 RepID=A0A6P0UJ76_9FLAO|nr:AMP-binding protein [Muriicola jejuensis]NER11133.1 AMP-binding protein [Muriicola jejuensis]SMP23967.1 O-succinylbenzoic acid--CoA ligase [Muriicola jejuensis]